MDNVLTNNNILIHNFNEQYNVFNTDGKTVAALHRGSLNAGAHSFSMAALPKGLYVPPFNKSIVNQKYFKAN